MICEAELPIIPGGWTTRGVKLAGNTFRIALPAVPDEFLEDPDVQAANASDDYMPYWPYLWPASVAMAAAVMSRNWPPGQPALELGCGIGLVGLAASARGLDVTFSDYDQQAIDLALYNARINGFRGASSVRLDWRHPQPSNFPIILASDVLYEARNQGLILDVLASTLASDGLCWIGDPGRHQTRSFVWKARERGFEVHVLDEHGEMASRSYPGRASMAGRFCILSLRRLN